MIKIFAHRGYVINEIKENSIESLDFAYKNNFDGVEYDVWFFENDLFINHDEPKIQEKNSLPKFQEYFKYKNEFQYWIDFKNFDKISIDSLRKSFEIIKNAIKNCEIDEENIYFAPFITSFDKALIIYNEFYKFFGKNIKIMAVIDEIEKKDLRNYCEILKENDIKFLSINHKNINQEFVEIFKEITIFTWTVNDFQRFQELKNLGIKNFTSDKITKKHV